MFEKKKKATKKNEDLMKKAPSSGAVELGDDVLEAAAGGARKTADRVMYSCNAATLSAVVRCSNCGNLARGWFCDYCGARFTFGYKIK